MKYQFVSINKKFQILIEKLDKANEKELIKKNKKKIENYIIDLPKIIETIFEKEKLITLKFVNLNLSE